MATIKDIASAAKVSISTVSRILNSDETIQVSPETRQRVLSIAAEMNYTKILLKKENFAGTVLITHWYTKELGLTDLYFSAIRWGVEITLKNAGYHVIRSIFNEDFPNFLNFSDIDGIIAIGEFNKENMPLLVNVKKPLVVINQNTMKYGISCITADYSSPVKEIISYFKEHNHQQIGLIDGISNSHNNKRDFLDPRSIIFREELQKNNELDEKLIFTGDFSIESGYQAMKTAIETLGPNLPTAFFAISDTMALGALRALNEAQISVPDDISIIGFGDLEVGQYFSPSLSTVQLSKRQMGTLGAMTLQNIMNGIQTDPINIVTATKLVIRESSK